MASREAMLDTIQSAYEARRKRDIDGLMAAFHPDAEFELKGERKLLEVAGATRGRSNVQATLVALMNSFEFVKRDIVNTIVEADRVSLHTRLEVRFVPKGTVFTTDVLDTFKFKDGKIIELVEFADTALIKSIVSS